MKNFTSILLPGLLFTFCAHAQTNLRNVDSMNLRLGMTESEIVGIFKAVQAKYPKKCHETLGSDSDKAFGRRLSLYCKLSASSSLSLEAKTSSISGRTGYIYYSNFDSLRKLSLEDYLTSIEEKYGKSTTTIQGRVKIWTSDNEGNVAPSITPPQIGCDALLYSKPNKNCNITIQSKAMLEIGNVTTFSVTMMDHTISSEYADKFAAENSPEKIEERRQDFLKSGVRPAL